MINIRKLEAELWESPDLLRAGSKLTSNQYCMPVLGLIFLRYAYSRFKLVEAELLTGRPHQIRASFADAGHPLLGDGKYGRGDVNRRYNETRQALYSYRLRFDFPTDAGILNYLRGREFEVTDIDFVNKYFG